MSQSTVVNGKTRDVRIWLNSSGPLSLGVYDEGQVNTVWVCPKRNQCWKSTGQRWSRVPYPPVRAKALQFLQQEAVLATWPEQGPYTLIVASPTQVTGSSVHFEAETAGSSVEGAAVFEDRKVTQMVAVSAGDEVLSAVSVEVTHEREGKFKFNPNARPRPIW